MPHIHTKPNPSTFMLTTVLPNNFVLNEIHAALHTDLKMFEMVRFAFVFFSSDTDLFHGYVIVSSIFLHN